MWMQKAQRITPWINLLVFYSLSYIYSLSLICVQCVELLAAVTVSIITTPTIEVHNVHALWSRQEPLGSFLEQDGKFQTGAVDFSLLLIPICWMVLSSSDWFWEQDHCVNVAGWCFPPLICFVIKIIVFMLLGGAFHLWFVLGTRLLCSCCWVVLSTSDWFEGQDHCVHVAGWCFSPDLFGEQDHCVHVAGWDKIIVFMLLGGAFHLTSDCLRDKGTRSLCSCCWVVLSTLWFVCFPPLIDLRDKIIVFMLLGGAFHLWVVLSIDFGNKIVWGTRSLIWGTRSLCSCCWVVLFTWIVWGTRSLCSCCWVVLSTSDLFGEQDHCVHVAGWCFPPLIDFGNKITVLCTSD